MIMTLIWIKLAIMFTTIGAIGVGVAVAIDSATGNTKIGGFFIHTFLGVHLVGIGMVLIRLFIETQ